MNPRQVKIAVINQRSILSKCLFHKVTVIGKKLFEWNFLFTNGIQRESYTWHGWSELVKLRNVSNLSICHGNSGRVMRG